MNEIVLTPLGWKYDKSLLCRNKYFESLLKYSNDISNIVRIFGEKVVRSYINYLHDIDEIDYDNIILLLKFLDFVGDIHVKLDFRKIPNLVDILSDPEINDILVINLIVKNMSFYDIWKLDFPEYKRFRLMKTIKRLKHYKYDDFSYELRYIRMMFGKCNRKHISNVLYLFIKYVLKNEGLQKSLLQDNDYEFYITLIDKGLFQNKNSYFIRIIRDLEISELPQDLKCYNVLSKYDSSVTDTFILMWNIPIKVLNSNIFLDYGFMVFY